MSQSDLLARIKSAAQSMRDAKLEIQNIEERLAQAKERYRTLERQELPDLMAEAGMPKMTIAAEGNLPAFEIKVKPFARANIAANWPEEKRQAAFDWLESNGHGDLIKTCITIDIPKEQHADAVDLLQKLQTMGYRPNAEETVHFMTLSKWLKECIGKGLIVPLDIVGGEVGMECSIKEVD